MPASLFVGLDLAELRSDGNYSSNSLAGVDSGFSLFDPDYELLRFPERPQDYDELIQIRDRERMAGVTLQALIRPIDHLVLSLGTRYSYDRLLAEFHCCEQGAPLDPVQRLKEEALTYQAGATYALTSDLNAYASYGTTFEPQDDLVAEGEYVDPEEGTAYEIGLKGERGRLSYSLALFHRRLAPHLRTGRRRWPAHHGAGYGAVGAQLRRAPAREKSAEVD